MISIEVDGTSYEVPSNAADTNWAAKQVAFEQALAEAVTDADTAATAATAAVTALSTAVKPTGVVGTPASDPGFTDPTTNYGRHVVHKIDVSYEAFANAGVGPEADVVAWVLPAKTRVLRVVADVTEAFQGGAIATCDLKCGRTGGSDDFLHVYDVLTAPVVIGKLQSELGDNVVGGSGFVGDLQWAAQNVVLNMVTDGPDIDTLSQGALTLYIETCTYP